jgi:ABC-type polysaccharide/polyol phosphate export permease
MAQSLRDYAQNWFRHSNKAERIWLMAKIEFKLRYYENKMGLLWALMKPISDMIIYYIAFGIILKIGTPNYVPFVFIGLILFNYFGECAGGTVQILQIKRYLYEYTNMDKLEIYLSVIISNFIGFIFNLVVFFIFCFFNHIGIDYHIIYMVPLFLNLVILSLAFSLILSNLYLVAKDVGQIWGIISSILFWLSPIIYDSEKFDTSLPALKYLNPLSGIIINVREIFMHPHGDHPLISWRLMGFDFIYAIFFLLIGISLLKNLGPRASEKL